MLQHTTELITEIIIYHNVYNPDYLVWVVSRRKFEVCKTSPTSQLLEPVSPTLDNRTILNSFIAV